MTHTKLAEEYVHGMIKDLKLRKLCRLKEMGERGVTASGRGILDNQLSSLGNGRKIDACGFVGGIMRRSDLNGPRQMLCC